MSWLSRNAEAIEAIAACITALVAVAALVGVKLQIDAAATQQLQQGARELYREHLTLSLQHPHFAEPGQCPSFTEDEETAYWSYLVHLLYTAEETIAADESWRPVMEDALEQHSSALCHNTELPDVVTSEVDVLVLSIVAKTCSTVPTCPDPE